MSVKEANMCFRKAEKLSNGKKGYFEGAVDGALRHLSGKWRSSELHTEIIALYSRAFELDSADTLSLYRRALEKLSVGDASGAEADLLELTRLGSPYARGLLGVRICLVKGDLLRAKTLLDVQNKENTAKGAPKYKLQDFVEYGFFSN